MDRYVALYFARLPKLTVLSGGDYIDVVVLLDGYAVGVDEVRLIERVRGMVGTTGLLCSVVSTAAVSIKFRLYNKKRETSN